MPVVRAKFDSAQTTPDNRRHWAQADGLAPNAAVNPEVRRILRNRARYEVANNSYAKGIVLTLANDTIGTGPRLQMLTDSADANRRIEDAFEEWSQAVDLAAKLRTMRMGRAESGEAFAVLTSNPGVDSPVTLDLKLIEPDQVTSPRMRVPRPGEVDGIVVDAAGKPVAYHVLKRHPGDSMFWRESDPLAFDVVPAASVIHYFRPDRPGQWRGIPDITPALPLFAQLRRYTLAVIAAAETAADFAAVLYTEAPAHGEAEALEPMDMVELEKRLATVLPSGWKLGQIHAEQPATTYAEFKKEILNEIARCLNMPFNVAAGNSSGYNYASGRLDHQTYFKSIRVEQHHLRGSGARPDPARLARRGGARRGPASAARARTRCGSPAHMVLGRRRARGPGQGSQRPGHAPGQPHDHARRGVRAAGPGLGRGTPPARQGVGAHARAGTDAGASSAHSAR
jgi:capsid protein